MVITSNHIRNGITVVLGLIIIFLLFRPQSCTRKGGEVTERGTADSTFYWKNKYNEEVASNRGTAAQFALQDERMKHLIDSVAKVYDTKNKRIQELIVATTRGVTHLTAKLGTKEGDTLWLPADNPDCPPVVRIRNVRETFENPYYTAKVQIGDSSYAVIDRRDTLTALWKDVKTGGIFNRKKYLQLDLNFADTSNHVTGLSAYRRQVPVKEWGIGPEAGALYFNNQVFLKGGANVSRQTGRFNVSLSGGYTTSTASPWYGETKVIYKLIRL